MEFHKVHLVSDGIFHLYQYYMSEPSSIDVDGLVNEINPPSCSLNITEVTGLKYRGYVITIYKNTILKIGQSVIPLKLKYSDLCVVSNFVQHKDFTLPIVDSSDLVMFAGNNIMVEKDSYDNKNEIIRGCNSDNHEVVHSVILRKYYSLFSSDSFSRRPVIMCPGKADYSERHREISEWYVDTMQKRWDGLSASLVVGDTYIHFIDSHESTLPSDEIKKVYLVGPSRLFIQDSPDIMSSLDTCKRLLHIKMIDDILPIADDVISKTKSLMRTSIESGKVVLSITYDGRLGACFSFRNINNKSYDHINVGPFGCKVRYNKMIDQMVPQTIKNYTFLPEFTLRDREIIFHRNMLYIDLPTSTYKLIKLDDL
jgi:hypothetical protein